MALYHHGYYHFGVHVNIVVIAPCNTDQTWSRCYGRGNLTLLPGTSPTTTNRGYSPWSLCGQPPRLRACSSRAPVASASGNDLLSSRTKGRDSQSIWYGSDMGVPGRAKPWSNRQVDAGYLTRSPNLAGMELAGPPVAPPAGDSRPDLRLSHQAVQVLVSHRKLHQPTIIIGQLSSQHHQHLGIISS